MSAPDPSSEPESAPSPAAPEPHRVGEGYAFETVRAHLGGKSTPPNFVIHREGVILGLCLGLAWNPKAEANPCEAWIGRNGELPVWGTKLAETKEPIPLYVRREPGGKWIYQGIFRVTGSTTDPAALRLRLNPPTITNISRVVFLQPSAAGDAQA